MADTIELTCDMRIGCSSPVTHLDDNGYIYCEPHGVLRQSYRPCRKLRPHELNRLLRGEPVESYA